MNLELIRQYVSSKLGDDKTGHDLVHIKRVEKNAIEIARAESAAGQMNLIRAAVLLHEMLDDKLFTNLELAEMEVRAILDEAGATAAEVQEIMAIIKYQSYSKNLKEKQQLTLAGQIVQDADRLDALGAIGVLRTAYYGGAKGHVLYNEDLPVVDLDVKNYRDSKNVVNHFYEKLFKLKDLMNTETGRELGEKRHAFMVEFIQQLKLEIEE